MIGRFFKHRKHKITDGCMACQEHKADVVLFAPNWNPIPLCEQCIEHLRPAIKHLQAGRPSL